MMRRRAATSAAESHPEPSNATNSDDAWKILNLVVDWIKHAESKAAATLAATGVSAGVLYNLVRPITGRSTIFVVASGLCAVLLLVAGVTAGVALAPRVRHNSDHTSPLFYQHIALAHSKSSGSAAYADELRTLSASGDGLVNEISAQIWANSHVAKAKYRWLTVAIYALLGGLACLGLTMATIQFGWTSYFDLKKS